MDTLVELFSRRAQAEPDAAVYTFLDAAGDECDRLSWGDIDRRARATARQLRAAGVGIADRVLVMQPPGLDYLIAIVGALYAGAVAVPMPHGPPRRLASRLEAIAVDCAARAVVCPAETIKAFERSGGARAARSLAWLGLECAETDAAGFTVPEIEPDALAVVQYTSGSTSMPKGVALSHRNIMANEALIQRAFDHDRSTVVVGWLPFYHDMGLMGNVLQTVFVGCRCILMSPFDFLQEPGRWLQAIAKYRGTTAGAPNFAYELCVHRTTPQQRAGLDLGSWRVAFNAAEPVRAATLDRFVDAFGPSGFRAEAFYPCYGLAEAVLFVTGGEAGRKPPRTRARAADADDADDEDRSAAETTDLTEFVSSGRVWPGQDVAIVDPRSRVGLPDDGVGEIWVRNGAVARGYFNRPLETAATFGAYRGDNGNGPYLRTGDLGFFRDGELYVTGRLNDLVILRGRKYHPHDIERTAEMAEPALRPGGSAAFTVTIDGEARLVLVSEVEQRSGFDAGKAAAAVRQAVADQHDVAIHAVAFVRVGQVPKTTSGKTRRRACRERYLDGTLVRLSAGTDDEASTASASVDTPTMSLVVDDVAALLNIAPSAVVADKSLTALGVDSLMAAKLLRSLETKTGVRLPLCALLQADSLRAIARAVVDAPTVAPDHSAAAAETKVEIPLSQGQRSLWSHWEIAPRSAAYNLGWAARLRGPLVVAALENAWSALVAAHGALRTTFQRTATDVRQRIGAPPPTIMTRIDASDWTEAELSIELREQVVRPFDFSCVPFEVCLYRRSDHEHVLLVRMHHIIGDLASADIVFDELVQGYEAARNGSRLPPCVRPGYADFVMRELAYLESGEADDALRYWRTQLSGELPALDLGSARPAAAPTTERSLPLRFTLASGLAEAVKDLARQSESTSHSVLLAAFILLLARSSGNSDILVGTPAADRDEPGSAGLIGYCVNMLPIRADLTTDPTFRQFVEQVWRRVLAALAHRRLPFSVTADRLDLRRRGGEPLIQAAFVWHGTAGPRGHHWLLPGTAPGFGDLDLEILDLAHNAAQFGLTLTMAESADGFAASFAYDGNEFERATVERLAATFCTLLAAITAAPDTRITRLPLVTSAERDTLLGAFAGPNLELPREATLPSLLRAARCHPESIALIGALGGPVAGLQPGAAMTRGQFDDLTARLAASLRDVHGVGCGDVVGVAIERSAAMVIAAHAVVAAGAAYLPLDPSGPDERNGNLLSEAGCRLLLSTASFAGRLSFGGTTIDIAAADAFAAVARPLRHEVAAADLAYVIYTSGSTGRPKGVMIEHRSAVNRLLWMAAALGFDAEDVVLHKTPATFDVSVWELFLPLIVGCRLVLLAPGDERDPARIFDCMRRHGVTTAHFVPSMLSGLLLHRSPDCEIESWRRCICSGEALHENLRDRFFEAFGDRVALFNLYGPTEAAIDVTWHKVLRDETPVPIGRPVANTAIRILDAADQLVPIGLPGELCISGIQVARGYLNRADLSRRSFATDPYAPGIAMYRTGDRACWRADGAIEYLGRRDAQVKIRGHRIELAEIEAVLRSHPAVIDAGVAVGDAGSEAPTLVTSLVTSSRPSQRALKAFMRRRLPPAMVPDHYLFVDVLPLNQAGKLDRRRLATTKLRGGRGFAPARNRDELRLIDIWQDELGFEPIGIDDSFFDIGGDSIRALRVVARSRAEGIAFSTADLYRQQTIRRLSGIAAPAEPVDEDRAPFVLIPAAWRDRLPEGVEDAYPLSALQLSLVHLSQTSASYEIYVTSLQVKAAFDADAMRRSVERLVARHPFLRAAFDLTSFPRPLQYVHRSAEVPCHFVDWRHLTGAEQDLLLEGWLAGERRQPFDWTTAPMLRVTIHRRSDDIFQFTFSDAALDGWCVASLITELFDDYLAATGGGAVPDWPPITASHRDFVAMEQRCVADPAAQQFWSDVLRRIEPQALRLPGRASIAAEARQRRVVTEFAELEWQQVCTLARDLSVPVRSVLLAVHLRVLALLAGPRAVTGIELNGRPEHAGGDAVVGAFNNMLPLPVELRPMAWAELARACWRAEQDIYPFRCYPHAQLRKDAGLAPFEAVFVYTEFHVYERLLDRPDFEILAADGSDQTFFPLTAHFNLDVRTGRLRLLLDVDQAMWPQPMAAAAADAYRRALRHMIADPAQRIDAAAFADPSELRQPAICAPPVRCFHEMFAEQAGRTPDRVAVVCGEAQLSYAKLDAAADRVAHRLRALGVGLEATVGVCMPHSPAMVIALLGIAKVGGIYVPLDPALPRQRLALMMEDSRVRCVVTTAAVGTILPPGVPVVLVEPMVDAVDGPRANAGAVDPHHAAYILYTSGSTGRPKGVVITHQALSNYLNWAIGEYRLEDSGPVPVHTSIGFDLTVTSLLAPLLAGTTVHLLSGAGEPDELGRALNAMPDSGLLKITPSHLTCLGHYCSGAAQLHAPRTIVIGGESLYAEQLARWPQCSASTIYNEYGPTEATVGCCVYRVPQPRPAAGPIPIGHAAANARLFVADDWDALVPAGLIGELLIGGPGLARGYLHDPVATAVRFTPDPFGAEPGGRLHRSGDLVRQLPQGELEYIGRRDRQFKCRGFRVDPAEIEAALAAHPHIRAAAVALDRETGPSERLVAHVVAAADRLVPAVELRRWLAQRLPDYMIPSIIVAVNELPLTRNGKLDRERLTVPALSGRDAETIGALLQQIERFDDSEVRVMLAAGATANGGGLDGRP